MADRVPPGWENEILGRVLHDGPVTRYLVTGTPGAGSAVDWRGMFARYAGVVERHESITYLEESEWTPEEWGGDQRPAARPGSERPAGAGAVTSHEIVIRLGRSFDVRTPVRFNDNGHPAGGAFLADVREITIPFADRESAFAAHREITVTVRPAHDAGGEDYRPVVAGEVIGQQPALTRPDALRESAREAHAKGRITSADLEDRLSRIAFMEGQGTADG